ncbi:hypothetical protein R50345_30400 [Paenibacillus sp. FSL R5-0345]|uniref:hypothetical protein n=1 Tax=Paenibacillus sp. FSL R5-0345 TaxID=1536770 RepID=UPI0004F6D823|nr:hypothetical protein [Paenibacillus sp. FSL R5-0345]AIQ38549.1 hypothetical protein R50345_30400 [Paenibacillus sp. FSL R5-0345]
MSELTKKEIESIARTISEHFGEYTTKYEVLKYPEEPYLKWKESFSDPKSVEHDEISKAFEWKYGHWGKSNFVPAHKVIIAKLQKHWPEFAEKGKLELDDIFAFWEERLAGHQSFITIAFLSHLICSKKVEIIDQHNFRAMNYLMSTVRPDWVWKRVPVSQEDITDFSAFVRSVLPAVKEVKGNKRELDKFLMMFGKHKVKGIAVSRSRVAPAITKKHDWNSFSSEVFDIGKITLRSNADLLFALLLQSLDADGTGDGVTYTIEEIQKRIPMQKTGIAVSSSYNYALVALFGNQRGRDYFTFENRDLGVYFTEQANDPSRDNTCWKKYLDEKVSINVKYVRAGG